VKGLADFLHTCAKSLLISSATQGKRRALCKLATPQNFKNSPTSLSLKHPTPDG
jgi:hypothetical protein